MKIKLSRDNVSAEECYTYVFVKNKKWAQMITLIGGAFLAIGMVAWNLKEVSPVEVSPVSEIAAAVATIPCTEQHDDPDFRYNGDPAKGCEWVAKRPQVRCLVVDGSCPISCNPDCQKGNVREGKKKTSDPVVEKKKVEHKDGATQKEKDQKTKNDNNNENKNKDKDKDKNKNKNENEDKDKDKNKNKNKNKNEDKDKDKDKNKNKNKDKDKDKDKNKNENEEKNKNKNKNENENKNKNKNKKISCVDDPKFKLNGNEDKHCSWVGKKIEKRCSKDGVLEACPVACRHPNCV